MLNSLQPLVSVIITSYNYEKFIGAAIESVIQQTYPMVEIVVVDDGSTDQSRQIIQSYQDKVIAIFQPNKGEAAATNTGFTNSSGSVVCFLDADDLFLPEKIAQVTEQFQSHPELDWCFHPLYDITQADQIISPPFTGEVWTWDLREKMKRGKLTSELDRPIPPTSGLCFRRSLLERILPIPENIRIICDSYMQFVALGISPGIFIDQPLAYYRHHGSNAYAENPQQLLLRARTLVLNGYWIHFNLPELERFADNLTAEGLASYWRWGRLTSEDQELIQSTLNALPLNKIWKIYLKALLKYSLH
ncbi:MAG: glycosyltransferase family 2 protein [Microcoleaceae cyanobacterium]